MMNLDEAHLNSARRHFYPGAGCQLSAVEFDAAESSRNDHGSKPALVLVHGMRDHAMSLYPLAEAFRDYRVISLDLRGHGHSDNPGSYSLVEFLADMQATYDYLEIDKSILFGHSLGGHIAGRFTAIWPERVGALIMADGMGPPAISNSVDSERADGDKVAATRTNGESMASANSNGGRMRSASAESTRVDGARVKSASSESTRVDGARVKSASGDSANNDDEALQFDVSRWQDTVNLINDPPPARIMASKDEARSRLMSGNPRLAPDLADLIIAEGVEETPQGYSWCFDARAAMIWMTFSHAESEQALRTINCPVLVVTGDEGLDYWAQMRPWFKGQEAIYQKDLAAKYSLFANCQSAVLSQAGHMLHYDQPELLKETIRHFLDGLTLHD